MIDSLITKDQCFVLDTFASKKQLIEYICDSLSNDCGMSTQTLSSAMLERERLGSTDLGYGVALPHIRHEEIDTPMARVVVLQNGIPYSDDEPESLVDIVIAIAVPVGDEDAHLSLLSQISEKLSSETVRKQLRSSTTPQEVCEVIHD